MTVPTAMAESATPGTDCGGAIWTDGTSFNGRIQDTIKRSESLSSMLAEAGCHVPSSIDFILRLLLPESFEGLDGQQEISEPWNLPDENLNGIECFHVGATGPCPKNLPHPSSSTCER
ncbi:MAG: hypothetical protein JST01_22060 [Cyanobacteria bacterium SZAS TMP-1]|nr:hypothetical protein [Cyanobacteria bacterium SZAS TMP-1]